MSLFRNIFIKSLVAVLLYYIISNLMNLYMYRGFEKYLSYEYFYLISPIMYSLFVLFFILVFKKSKNLNFINKYKVDYILILKIVFLAILFRIFSDPILRIFHIISYEKFPEINIRQIILKYKIASFYSFVILVPIIEELFFRGLILNRLLKNNNYIVSILYSAILFSLIHISYLNVEGSLLKALYTFLMGVLLGFIYFKTNKNITFVIAFHFITI